MSPPRYATVAPLLRSLLRERYGEVDAAIPAMLSVLSDRGADECWHKHSTFMQHLVGVWRSLTLFSVCLGRFLTSL